ncbi:TPA: hypothetical protein N0F65_001767 [Lagenidium giganteum]|uniref:PX domain-containing protein n=1 Tax=Lagenidium giganteum TaxID=4803 RepID=A0AAV2Z6W7_9STRA|nr:TPA: hypothetical protein N0F65_001767 [Lagenidium giganteum]
MASAIDLPRVGVGGGASPVGAHAASKHAKKTPQSCRIDSYTIQKCASPKKKALDPLRYIPERQAFYALFTLTVTYEDNSMEQQVYRTHKQFASLHEQLLKKFPKSKLPKEVPSMRKKRYDNEYIEEKRQRLNEYLCELFTLPEIKSCKIFRAFLEDMLSSDESEDDSGVSSKVLEGMPGTIVTVRAGQSFSVSLNLQPGDTASWQFTTKKHDIGFSATFNGETVRVYSKEESSLRPVKGSFKCSEAGMCVLTWDNTYTWSKGKTLIYWAEVEQSRTTTTPELKDASAARDTVGSLADCRRSGYIVQNRSHALHPRQIVNSSISLITKPFVSGKQNRAHLKCGMLIVERTLKFRGRNWYRKWFVLDSRKHMLRYYDSEEAARKGLSLAKINLSAKNACLAITSIDEAAPTTFMFMVRARKRCWKICTTTLAEHNEWEHAISTAILAAQLSRRNRRGAAVAGGNDVEGSPERDEPMTKESMGLGVSGDDDEDTDDDKEDDKEDDDEESEEDRIYDSDAGQLRQSGGDDGFSGLVETTGATLAMLSPLGLRDMPPLPDLPDPDSLLTRCTKLPLSSRLGILAVLNLAFVLIRQSPTALLMLILVGVDGYLVVRYLQQKRIIKLGRSDAVKLKTS